MEIKETEVPREGNSLESLEQKEKETPAESSPEINQNGETPSPEGVTENIQAQTEVPFHKHPRWQEMQQANMELRQKVEENEKLLQGIPQYLDTFRQQLTSKDAPPPDWFVELYGDSPRAWELYQQHEARRYDEIASRVKQDLETQQQAQISQAKHWDNWVNSEVKHLEETGTQFDKNELFQVMLKYQPVENGSLSFSKGLEILQAIKVQESMKTKEKTRKAIADATSPSSGGEKGTKDYLTSADLRGKGWTSL